MRPPATVQERRAQLRAILQGDRFVRPASVYDALSARAAEQLGFEIMLLAGSAAALTVLAAPDLALLTLSELAEQCRRITRAASLPLIVDADHGYGNALGVARCVHELEAAGVAAVSIEDTWLPRPFGEAEESFISVPEAVGKLRAALEARGDPGLVVLGRTASARGLGLKEAIDRARAYEAAGVDALFFTGLRSRLELEALRAACRLPFVISATAPELQDHAYLASRGVRIGDWSHRPIEAATHAMYHALRQLQESAPTAEELPASEILDLLSRASDYRAAADRYLRPLAGSDQR